MLDLSLLPELKYNGQPALPPQKQDLERLYNLIIKHRSTTVLEFGCGYSTLVIEQALEDNDEWFNGLDIKPKVRNSYLFNSFSMDTSESWAKEIYEKANHKIFITDSYKYEFNGRIVHRYNFYPPINPDFIYLDGPDPAQIEGWNECWTPISADILYLEPILLPGTVVLIDGRTNNARFLERNLQRNWKIEWNPEEDYTLMELDEPSLGKVVANGKDILEWLQNNKS